MRRYKWTLLLLAVLCAALAVIAWRHTSGCEPHGSRYVDWHC